MTKLKIPSKFLKITGGPFKGYEAEFKDRLRQGEFLVVNIGATGNEATIPISNIIFVMEDGRLLRYIPVQTGLSLIEVGKEESGEIIVVRETIDSPSRGLPVFFPETDLENIEIETIETGDNPEVDYGDEEAEREEESKEDLLTENYIDTLRAFRDVVVLDDSIVTQYISELFQILGFHMDNVSINHHSKILQDAIKNNLLQGLEFTEDLLKSFVIAYIFIHVNNMGIGYPISIPGVKMKSNDDPSFIANTAFKRQFTKSLFNIEGQIQVLSEILQTKIVPSTGMLSGIANRFALLRVSSKTKKSTSLIANTGGKLKMLKFPLYEDTYKKQSEIKAKTVILNKLSKKIKNSSDEISKNMLQNLQNNFDVYIKGPTFKKLNNDPDLLESKVLFPYIKEYKERLEIEEEKFYQDANKMIVKNASYKKVVSPEKQIIKKEILKSINAKLESVISKDNTEQDRLLKYIITNSEKISNMTSLQFKEMKVRLNTADSSEKEKIAAITEYHSTVLKVLEKSKQKMTDRQFSKKRKNYEVERLTNKFEKLNSQAKKTKVSVQI